jgi:hypothetical protein
MTKRKIFIIGLVFLSLMSLIYIFVIINKDTENTTTGITKPKLVSQYKGKYSLVFSVDRDHFNFPEKLPLLGVSSSKKPIEEASAKNIALNLGFLGDPTTIDDSIDGICYFWKNDVATLFVFSASGVIRYDTRSFSESPNKQLSDAEMSSVVEKFITNNNLLDDVLFQIGKIKYLKQIPNGEGYQETDKKTAVLFEISILPKTTDYEFISISSTQPSSYVLLKQDGSISSFQITLFSDINKGLIEYNLKNYDEVTRSIGEAVLIELSGDTRLLSDVSPGLISNIEISKIEIAYLMEENKTSMQPVYKLTGEATLSNSNYKYIATLYPPAFLNSLP